MASSDVNKVKDVKHSDPITIPVTARGRVRSMSVSSASSGSGSSGSELPTPASSSIGRISIPSPSTSPILSYFLAQSPTKTTATAATFPFKRKFGTSAVVEEETDKEIPVAAHARRASVHVANRFSQNPPAATYPADVHNERGTSLLRRLSLSSTAFSKPQLDIPSPVIASPPSPPPNTAVSPTPRTAPFSNKPRRSATISIDAKPRRAPSPMGERILKGHFDGFN